MTPAQHEICRRLREEIAAASTRGEATDIYGVFCNSGRLRDLNLPAAECEALLCEIQDAINDKSN